jgi:NADPH-dependent glutamate synthase beta subunit-like oxidoreductase
MSIEQEVLDKEYDLMLKHLHFRAEQKNFSIEDIRQELEHLLIYQGQDWVGRGEIKNAEIQGQVYAYQVFLKRWRDRNESASTPSQEDILS